MFVSAAVIALHPIAAQEVSNKTKRHNLGRSVRVETTVKAPVAGVWRIFTTSEGAEEFFAEEGNIRLAIGGPFKAVQIGERSAIHGQSMPSIKR